MGTPAPRARQGVTASGNGASTSGGEAAPDANRALQKLAALKALNPDAFPEGSVRRALSAPSPCPPRMPPMRARCRANAPPRLRSSLVGSDDPCFLPPGGGSFKPFQPDAAPGSRGGGGIDVGDDPDGEPHPLGRIASRLLGRRWRAVLAALVILLLAGLFFKAMHAAGWGMGRDEALLDWKPTNATATAIPESSEALMLAEQPKLAVKDEGVLKGLSAKEEIAEKEEEIAEEIHQLQKKEEAVRPLSGPAINFLKSVAVSRQLLCSRCACAKHALALRASNAGDCRGGDEDGWGARGRGDCDSSVCDEGRRSRGGGRGGGACEGRSESCESSRGEASRRESGGSPCGAEGWLNRSCHRGRGNRVSASRGCSRSSTGRGGGCHSAGRGGRRSRGSRASRGGCGGARRGRRCSSRWQRRGRCWWRDGCASSCCGCR